MTNKQYIIIAGVVVLVGGGAFYGGMRYAQQQRARNFTQFANSQFGGTRGGRTPGQNQGVRPVIGQVVSQDDSSITVKSADGSSKIVLLSGSTKIEQTQEASKSAIQSGTQVAVFGSENSDGSVTAQNVQLNPQFNFRMGTGGPNGQGAPRP